jgi:hypothetical protein
MATVYKIVLLRHGESEWCAPPAPDAATRDYARSDGVPPLRCVMTLALLPRDEDEPLRSVPRRKCQAHSRVARLEAHPLASTLYCALSISLPLRVLTSPTLHPGLLLPFSLHRNRSNQFTGWTDVDLTELGVEEAGAAGKLLKAEVSGGPWAPPPPFPGPSPHPPAARTHAPSLSPPRLLDPFSFAHTQGFEFDVAYTSVLKRAIRTLW